MDVDPKILNRYMTDRVKLTVRLDEDAKAGDILTARMTDDGMLYARHALAPEEFNPFQTVPTYMDDASFISEEAKRAVETWRRNFAAVVDFWASQNGVFADAGPPAKPAKLQFGARDHGNRWIKEDGSLASADDKGMQFERVEDGAVEVWIGRKYEQQRETLTPEQIAALKEWL